MNRKGFSNILAIILALVIVAGVIGYFMFFQKSETPATTNIPTTSVSSLSSDKKSVIADSKVLLTIDNNVIFNWFYHRKWYINS